MATIGGGYGLAGVGAAVGDSPRNIFWGGDRGKGQIITQSAIYSSAIADAGNTPTTTIRSGLLVAELSSSGELEEWDADAVDGTQDLFGVNELDFTTLDRFATAGDRELMVVVRAPLKASQLLIQGTALTSHADEFLARRALHSMGCILDDDPQGYKAGAGNRQTTVTGTTDTLTEAENGSTIYYNNTGSTTVTLPAIHAGLEYTLIRSGDEEFVVTSAEGDNMIVGNDLAADSVTFTTAGEHIGAAVVVRGVYVLTTLKWQVFLPQIAFGTDGTGLTYAIGT